MQSRLPGALAVRVLVVVFAFSLSRAARATPKDAPTEPHDDKGSLRVRGYTQLRYDRLLDVDPSGPDGASEGAFDRADALYLRRARVVLSGAPAKFLSVYLQADFATALDEKLHLGQLRDAYADIFLDGRKELRLRVGQSKVPYGFELMQSSQQRAPLDRSDGLNSAFPNERDVGAIFYYSPTTIRRRFRELVDAGLKGSGDYGMVAVGWLNGQPANTPEKNDGKHFVARISVPFPLGSQLLEIGGGGYTGLFVPKVASPVESAASIRDFRVHGTFVLYPKPLGIQAEYNVGVGPELHGTQVVERSLGGGYVMAMFRHVTAHMGVFLPYVRAHRYDGGRKSETNSPRQRIREWNAGLEWQLGKWLECTIEYQHSTRTTNELRQTAQLLRAQLQFNY